MLDNIEEYRKAVLEGKTVHIYAGRQCGKSYAMAKIVEEVENLKKSRQNLKL